MKIKDKVAIVTGAASGIGKAIAICFAQEGAKVVASDINWNGVQNVVAEINAAGGTASAIKTNVALQVDVERLIDETVNLYGTVDILVNNAGIMDNLEPAGAVTDEDWDRIFKVNVTSVLRTTRKVLPIFLGKGKGNIINIASIGGLTGKVAGCAYTASKYAVIGITKNTGFMYANEGIRCNAIAPGAIMTNIQSTMTNINEFGAARTGLSLNLNPRSADPSEIASVALFLASDDSSFVNGAVLVADGGWMA